MIVSSSQLATAASVNPAILRKDLSYIGANGVRGVGYDVARLTARISLALHATGEFRVALAGAGVLARMLMAHTGPGRGFEVVAMFDSDPAEIGRRYSMRRQTYAEARADESIGSGADQTVPDEVVVEPMDDIARVCDVAGVDIAVIATADDTAQAACDAFAGAGVRQMLNMTSVPVRVPDHVVVRPVDIGLELQVLAFDASRATNPAVDAGADERAASAGTSGVGAALR